MGRGLGSMDKAIGSMKSFKSTLDELAKTRLDLGQMSGDLGKLGAAINDTFGAAQTTVLNRFKQSISDLKQEAERASASAQVYEKQADRARAMGNQAFADMYKAKAQGAAVRAGGLAQAAQQYQWEAEDYQDQQAYRESFVGGMENTMQGWAKGAMRPINRAMTRAGISMGGIARGLGVAGAAAAFVGMTAGAIADYTGPMQQRMFALEQQGTWGGYQAAANLDPTILALQQMGAQGAEAKYMGSGWRQASYVGGEAIQRLLRGDIGGIFKGEEMLRQGRLAMRAADQEAFQAAYAPATQSFYQRQQQYYDIHKTFGTGATEQMLGGLYIGGISNERLGNLLGITMGAGGATTPDLTTQRVRELYRGTYTYGMSQRAVEQLAVRQAAGVPNAFDAAQRALGAGGMQTFTGAQALSDVQGAYMANQSVRTGYSGAELIGALAGQAGRAGMPEPIAAQVGGTVAAATGAMAGQRGTLLSASLESTMLQSGVTNFFQRSAILDLLRQNRLDEAKQAFMKATGKSAGEAEKVLGGAFRAQTQFTKQLLGGGTEEVLAAGGLGSNWLYTGDVNAQMAGAPGIGQDPFAARRGEGGPMGPMPAGARAFGKTAEDTRQEAAGQGQAQVVEHTKEIRDQITKIVELGLRIQPESMTEALKQVKSLTPAATTTPATESRDSAAFTGRGKK
jgi:hypothetical protein